MTLPSPLRPLPAGAGGVRGVAAASALLHEAGLVPLAWSNGPGDRYATHEHPYTKVIVFAEGSITFLVGADEIPVELRAGQGFELPPHTRHAAVVGPAGCSCVEGHRR